MENKENINRLLKNFRELRRNLREVTMDLSKNCELTLPQLAVVSILVDKGPLKAKHIANLAGLANSTTSGILDRLEKKAIITRVRKDTDRRSTIIELTPGSDQHYYEFRQLRDEYFYSKLSDLNAISLENITLSLEELNMIFKHSITSAS